MQDHLYDFELLLKPASKGEKLAVAQTVSPFDTNAKAQNRKMVSIPAKASGYSGVFWPAFFPSAPEPRKAPCWLSTKNCDIPVDLYEFNKLIFRVRYGTLRGSGAYGMKQYRKGGKRPAEDEKSLSSALICKRCCFLYSFKIFYIMPADPVLSE